MPSSTEALIKLPFGPPPILPDIEEELKNVIECPEKLPIHQLDNTQCYWPRTYDVSQLLNYDLAPIGTTIKYRRDPITGNIGDIHEIILPNIGKTAKNSMSLDRAPAPPCDAIRGNPSNFLFWPGGFDEPEKEEINLAIDIDFENNLKTCAKGLKAGIKFHSDKKTPKEDQSAEDDAVDNNESDRDKLDFDIDLKNVIDQESKYFNITTDSSKADTSNKNDDKKNIDLPEVDENITKLSETHKIPVLKISENQLKRTEWAEELDVQLPVTDFNKKVPDPALTFPYELDNFQKQAIIKLEENCNVFVAAHTSAGKTTVAEYAIALSQKHMTRTIYTSPIKALSNQKFREFKEKFESVGLITGDIQINPTASCLIMTTEILQSMLYCASEVIRDLEYVIFDEIHYINNEDRGHVWEEIVILLPLTVTIVMLSATVPNPVEFATWVGKIKQRKMYVISTIKRPVPLQHYLYTAVDMKTKDNSFLVVDTDGVFQQQGWHDAMQSKIVAAAQNKGQRKKPPPYYNNANTSGKEQRPGKEKKTETQIWAPLLEHLIRKDKLPVVVFTFSRNRCDSSAKAMKRHLITDEQKREVEQFFKTSIKRLKDSDARLPQVSMIRNLLMSGVGIHHSGILPILKEIVEMLFQRGLVKMLFATETFAMGVNMPARTVIFDSIRKFDGNDFRMLHPTEYIQMAGRAGRRGHDSIGIVMVYCKYDVPNNTDLHKMMCGTPQSLQSRFKVTYSMVLHLRRLNETISVKDMMRRSFGEAGTQHNQKQCMFEYEQIERDLEHISKTITENEKLNKLYDNMVEYKKIWNIVKMKQLTTKNAMKHLKEERVIIISHEHHVNKLAVILTEQQYKFKVFVLKDDVPEPTTNVKPMLWYDMIALHTKNIYIPSGKVTYEILEITPTSITGITKLTVKCEIRSILSNWDNCKIYKSRNAKPNQACMKVINQLMELSVESYSNPSLFALIPIPVENVHYIQACKRMSQLEAEIASHNVTDIDEFIKEFEPIFNYRELLGKKEKLRQTLSGETMEHYNEYKSRVEILKDLGYIDEDERVTLKGRVALEMGTHELLLTELVLKNILTDWDPAEIASVLSALVFQKRSNKNSESSDSKPSTKLEKSIKIVEEEFKLLDEKEKLYMLPKMAPINFELSPVVYRWAKQESFANIMQHTDIQEGIIVRCIQQLNETLRDVRNASIIIGNPILKTKMEQASTAIKRDIVFAASLYTQD